ncbi:MAG: uracil-DNA glycosylase [Planctomycetaceae bacterium]
MVTGRGLQQILRSWHSAGLGHLARTVPGEPEPVIDSPAPPARAEAPRAAAPPVTSTASTPPADTQTPMARKSSSAAAAPELPVIQVAAEATQGGSRESRLSALAARVAQCQRCQELASTRTQTVFGVGNPNAKVMFIGEAPGADEDATGEPFVGRAGQLLTKIIEACGWTRAEIYICNILRCRPPGNRAPSLVEARHCREYLDGQIAIIQPEYIVCWGTTAAQNLLGSEETIGKMRGRFYTHGKAKVLCTYHPSYLLRNPEAKKPVWEDMKLLLAEMGLTPPSP